MVAGERRVRVENGICHWRAHFSLSSRARSPQSSRAGLTKSLITPKRKIATCFFCSSFIGKPPCELFPAVYPKGGAANRERFGRVSEPLCTPQIKPRG